MAEITKTDNDTSAFLVGSFEAVESRFTDMQELCAQGYTLLLRAKRYGRWFVLKTLREETAGQTAYLQILRKELEVLMLMQHPGVVQVMGMEDVDGLGPTIIMEYVDGDTLAALLARDALGDVAQRRRMALELCEALAYVHSLGIVHRDLKPENIMVTHNGQRIKLIDFGMADTDQHAVLKQPAGTLSYMAPEQAVQAHPDVRNDIYSLGLILQEMRLGRRYQKVTDRCLKPIDQRYRNMGELLHDMRRLQGTPWQTVLQWSIVVLLAVVLGIMGVQIWRLQHANRQLRGELTRVQTATEAGMEALEQQMEASMLNLHVDTLSHWAYRWPDLNARLMGVCRYIYKYVDELPPQYAQHDRDQIRDAMLSRYQQWSESLNSRLVAIKRQSE